MNNKVKICQHGTDGFGHQLEGMLRLISLSLNNKAEYIYNLKNNFTFEHSNFDLNNINLYLVNALHTLSNNSPNNEFKNGCKIIYNETRSFKEIIENDINYLNSIYCYDGVGFGQYLPNNFENIEDMQKSLSILRNAFVLKNPFLPNPTYDKKYKNIVCHIRLGDAVGQRLLNNDEIINLIKDFQKNSENFITIHSDGDIKFLESSNTKICDKNTDVLQILSDFVNADILVINYSSLSIAGHLLADNNQTVICPNIAGPTFYYRILNKCIKISSYKKLLINKKYSWQNDSITFLENGKMNAFGEGNYTQEDKYIFESIFGGRIHRIVFNEDYTEFTSTRKDDNQIVKGKLL